MESAYTFVYIDARILGGPGKCVLLLKKLHRLEELKNKSQTKVEELWKTFKNACAWCTLDFFELSGVHHVFCSVL